jgi:hypothetical protein
MSIAEKLQTIAENEQKVYEAGKQAEYDAFWDSYQDCGNRINYSYAFAGIGWTDETFKPKYPIKAVGGYSTGMFTNGANIQNKVIEADFSDATSMTNTFNGANVKHIGVLNCPNVSNFNLTWLACSAEQIDLIKLNKNGGQKFTSSFERMVNLIKIRFEGLISENVGFPNSALLDKESVINIFSVLSTDSTGKTLSLSLGAVDTAFETAEGLGDGSTSAEWLALRATKENWTVTLV